MPFDEWMTPPNVIELARTAMGSIDFDPASNWTAQEYVKAKEFCVHPDTMDEWMGYGDCPPDNLHFDGLKTPWHGNVWCNPPYSAGNIDAFVDFAVHQWENGINIRQMMFLVNSATDTKWYHKLIKHSDFTMLWKGRIKFWKIIDGVAYEKWEGEKSKAEGKGKIGNSPRYLNTLFYFGNRRSNVEQVFDVYASIMELR